MDMRQTRGISGQPGLGVSQTEGTDGTDWPGARNQAQPDGGGDQGEKAG